MLYYDDTHYFRTNLKRKESIVFFFGFSYVAIFEIPFASARLNNLIDMRERSNSSHLDDFQSVCFFKTLFFYL